MASSHSGGGLFTAMFTADAQTVRHDSMCKFIRNLSSYKVFHGDSENMSFK